MAPQSGPTRMQRCWYIPVSIGAVLIIGGIIEATQGAAAKPEPQEISCEALVTNGYGDNAHVRMTDFFLCEEAYIYEENKFGKTVWVPAVPRGGSVHASMVAATRNKGRNTPLPGREIRIIVSLRADRSEDDVARVAAEDSVQGLLIKPTRLFGSAKHRLLEGKYPGLNLDRCMMLIAGRKPASRTKILGAFWGGAAFLAVGGLLLYRYSRSRSAIR